MKPLIAFLLAVTLFPVTANALGGKLTSPSLSYRSDSSAIKKEKINKVIQFMGSDLKFIEGSFLNQFSFQRFGGTAKQVLRLIKLLNEAGLPVSIQFRDFGEQKSAFTLDEDSSKDYRRIIINSRRDDFKLSDFRAFLPMPRWPSQTKPERKGTPKLPVRQKLKSTAPATIR
ncbi:MAG: hypothetical protein HON53_11300 [Planctomycetaceae bacterium]|jgi:hypothetical protein|nr:hypothetical protein [Planctomycetaceae bacterium]MBT6153423.1 hypothetical protein [Planctomycetaceae bacterium]MBT6485021.1 hypothetical protein [Planctomycetaceae bacterium]MBT6497493.1 hypothetical protein [Planctomycetaceae bacterium]